MQRTKAKASLPEIAELIRQERAIVDPHILELHKLLVREKRRVDRARGGGSGHGSHYADLIAALARALNPRPRKAPPFVAQPAAFSYTVATAGFNFDRLREEGKEINAQEKRSQALVAKIFKEGYRSLAAKAHPDVGGNAQEMQELNIAKNRVTKKLKQGGL